MIPHGRCRAQRHGRSGALVSVRMDCGGGSLDIAWLKDGSDTAADELPEPALEELREILNLIEANDEAVVEFV